MGIKGCERMNPQLLIQGARESGSWVHSPYRPTSFQEPPSPPSTCCWELDLAVTDEG